LLSIFASATVFAALFGVSLTDNFGTFAGCCGSSSVDCVSVCSLVAGLASSVESSVACFTGNSDDFEVSGGGWLWFGSSSVVISTSWCSTFSIAGTSLSLSFLASFMVSSFCCPVLIIASFVSSVLTGSTACSEGVAAGTATSKLFACATASAELDFSSSTSFSTLICFSSCGGAGFSFFVESRSLVEDDVTSLFCSCSSFTSVDTTSTSILSIGCSPAVSFVASVSIAGLSLLTITSIFFSSSFTSGVGGRSIKLGLPNSTCFPSPVARTLQLDELNHRKSCGIFLVELCFTTGALPPLLFPPPDDDNEALAFPTPSKVELIP